MTMEELSGYLSKTDADTIAEAPNMDKVVYIFRHPIMDILRYMVLISQGPLYPFLMIRTRRKYLMNFMMTLLVVLRQVVQVQKMEHFK